MRFLTKKKPEPPVGFQKRVVKFAFLPRTVEGHTIWLERYYADVQWYKEYYDDYDGTWSTCGWKIVDTKLFK